MEPKFSPDKRWMICHRQLHTGVDPYGEGSETVYQWELHEASSGTIHKTYQGSCFDSRYEGTGQRGVDRIEFSDDGTQIIITHLDHWDRDPASRKSWQTIEDVPEIQPPHFVNNPG